MIYFFAKQHGFVQCEVHPGRPHVFTVIASDGRESTEIFTSATALQQRWSDVTEELRQAGWHGPFGRDSRV